MFHLILVVIAHQFFEEGLQDVVFVGQGEDMGGRQPQKHADELGSQRFHHFALELGDVYLAELIDVREYLFR